MLGEGSNQDQQPGQNCFQESFCGGPLNLFQDLNNFFGLWGQVKLTRSHGKGYGHTRPLPSVRDLRRCAKHCPWWRICIWTQEEQIAQLTLPFWPYDSDYRTGNDSSRGACLVCAHLRVMVELRVNQHFQTSWGLILTNFSIFYRNCLKMRGEGRNKPSWISNSSNTCGLW